MEYKKSGFFITIYNKLEKIKGENLPLGSSTIETIPKIQKYYKTPPSVHHSKYNL